MKNGIHKPEALTRGTRQLQEPLKVNPSLPWSEACGDLSLVSSLM